MQMTSLNPNKVGPRKDDAGPASFRISDTDLHNIEKGQVSGSMKLLLSSRSNAAAPLSPQDGEKFTSQNQMKLLGKIKEMYDTTRRSFHIQQRSKSAMMPRYMPTITATGSSQGKANKSTSKAGAQPTGNQGKQVGGYTPMTDSVLPGSQPTYFSPFESDKQKGFDFKKQITSKYNVEDCASESDPPDDEWAAPLGLVYECIHPKPIQMRSGIQQSTGEEGGLNKSSVKNPFKSLTDAILSGKTAQSLLALSTLASAPLDSPQSRQGFVSGGSVKALAFTATTPQPRPLRLRVVPLRMLCAVWTHPDMRVDMENTLLPLITCAYHLTRSRVNAMNTAEQRRIALAVADVDIGLAQNNNSNMNNRNSVPNANLIAQGLNVLKASAGSGSFGGLSLYPTNHYSPLASSPIQNSNSSLQGISNGPGSLSPSALLTGFVGNKSSGLNNGQAGPPKPGKTHSTSYHSDQNPLLYALSCGLTDIPTIQGMETGEYDPGALSAIYSLLVTASGIALQSKHTRKWVTQSVVCGNTSSGAFVGGGAGGGGGMGSTGANGSSGFGASNTRSISVADMLCYIVGKGLSIALNNYGRALQGKFTDSVMQTALTNPSNSVDPRLFEGKGRGQAIGPGSGEDAGRRVGIQGKKGELDQMSSEKIGSSSPTALLGNTGDNYFPPTAGVAGRQQISGGGQNTSHLAAGGQRVPLSRPFTVEECVNEIRSLCLLVEAVTRSKTMRAKLANTSSGSNTTNNLSSPVNVLRKAAALSSITSKEFSNSTNKMGKDSETKKEKRHKGNDEEQRGGPSRVGGGAGGRNDGGMGINHGPVSSSNTPDFSLISLLFETLQLFDDNLEVKFWSVVSIDNLCTKGRLREFLQDNNSINNIPALLSIGNSSASAASVPINRVTILSRSFSTHPRSTLTNFSATEASPQSQGQAAQGNGIDGGGPNSQSEQGAGQQNQMCMDDFLGVDQCSAKYVAGNASVSSSSSIMATVSTTTSTPMIFPLSLKPSYSGIIRTTCNILYKVICGVDGDIPVVMRESGLHSMLAPCVQSLSACLPKVVTSIPVNKPGSSEGGRSSQGDGGGGSSVSRESGGRRKQDGPPVRPPLISLLYQYDRRMGGYKIGDSDNDSGSGGERSGNFGINLDGTSRSTTINGVGAGGNQNLLGPINKLVKCIQLSTPISAGFMAMLLMCTLVGEGVGDKIENKGVAGSSDSVTCTGITQIGVAPNVVLSYLKGAGGHELFYYADEEILKFLKIKSGNNLANLTVSGSIMGSAGSEPTVARNPQGSQVGDGMEAGVQRLGQGEGSSAGSGAGHQNSYLQGPMSYNNHSYSESFILPPSVPLSEILITMLAADENRRDNLKSVVGCVIGTQSRGPIITSLYIPTLIENVETSPFESLVCLANLLMNRKILGQALKEYPGISDKVWSIFKDICFRWINEKGNSGDKLTLLLSSSLLCLYPITEATPSLSLLDFSEGIVLLAKLATIVVEREMSSAIMGWLQRKSRMNRRLFNIGSYIPTPITPAMMYLERWYMWNIDMLKVLKTKEEICQRGKEATLGRRSLASELQNTKKNSTERMRKEGDGNVNNTSDNGGDSGHEGDNNNEGNNDGTTSQGQGLTTTFNAGCYSSLTWPEARKAKAVRGAKKQRDPLTRLRDKLVNEHLLTPKSNNMVTMDVFAGRVDSRNIRRQDNADFIGGNGNDCDGEGNENNSHFGCGEIVSSSDSADFLLVSDTLDSYDTSESSDGGYNFERHNSVLSSHFSPNNDRELSRKPSRNGKDFLGSSCGFQSSMSHPKQISHHNSAIDIVNDRYRSYESSESLSSSDTISTVDPEGRYTQQRGPKIEDVRLRGRVTSQRDNKFGNANPLLFPKFLFVPPDLLTEYVATVDEDIPRIEDYILRTVANLKRHRTAPEITSTLESCMLKAICPLLNEDSPSLSVMIEYGIVPVVAHLMTRSRNNSFKKLQDPSAKLNDYSEVYFWATKCISKVSKANGQGDLCRKLGVIDVLRDVMGRNNSIKVINGPVATNGAAEADPLLPQYICTRRDRLIYSVYNSDEFVEKVFRKNIKDNAGGTGNMSTMQMSGRISAGGTRLSSLSRNSTPSTLGGRRRDLGTPQTQIGASPNVAGNKSLTSGPIYPNCSPSITSTPGGTMSMSSVSGISRKGQRPSSTTTRRLVEGEKYDEHGGYRGADEGDKVGGRSARYNGFSLGNVRPSSQSLFARYAVMADTDIIESNSLSASQAKLQKPNSLPPLSPSDNTYATTTLTAAASTVLVTGRRTVTASANISESGYNEFSHKTSAGMGSVREPNSSKQLLEQNNMNNVKDTASRNGNGNGGNSQSFQKVFVPVSMQMIRRSRAKSQAGSRSGTTQEMHPSTALGVGRVPSVLAPIHDIQGEEDSLVTLLLTTKLSQKELYNLPSKPKQPPSADSLPLCIATAEALHSLCVDGKNCDAMCESKRRIKDAPPECGTVVATLLKYISSTNAYLQQISAETLRCIRMRKIEEIEKKSNNRK